MAAPTAADLLERLRTIYEEREGTRLSDEKLAGRLPITLSTFNRWKRGDTRSFRDVVTLLDQAGWLNMGEAEPAISSPASQGVDHLEEIAAALKDLTESQAEILRRLPPGDADALPPARPKRK